MKVSPRESRDAGRRKVTMTRRKTAFMKWMDDVLRSDAELAKAVEERLEEMRGEQDEMEPSRNAPPGKRVGSREVAEPIRWGTTSIVPPGRRRAREYVLFAVPFED